ncbi:MAG: hydantoinase B/oxoprolinase family protein, partial [bacterium]
TLANDLLSAVAEEMALALELAAHSSNIKDRRDLSTAVFDADGQLLAQGAHIPVHLGSMQASVEAVREAISLAPDESAIVNSPYHGGTHLPDLTLVTCVDLGASQGFGYVASRAHHADIGGSAPGSMPLSDRLEDEGILIPPTRFATGEAIDPAFLERITSSSRQPDERRGDLLAQLGANLRGAARLQELVKGRPAGWFRETSTTLRAYAASMIQTAWREWPDGTATGSSALDGDGLTVGAIPITVRATLATGIDGSRSLTLDFSGTSAAVPGPVNCPRAVTLAGVSFVLRCLAPPGTPTNAGMLRDVTLAIPTGCLIDAPYPHPTAAGNVETSQKIVAALFDALRGVMPSRIPAGSQATMNNVLFGGTDPATGAPFTYYETLAGGSGAGPHGPGASALHTHMTNSRNTPIEVVEQRFPVRIERYAVRTGSGGVPLTVAGHFGGDGIVRGYRFLAPVTLTLIADWPASDAASSPQSGAAWLTDRDGKRQPLPSKWSGAVAAGSLLEIATPGGWAWDPS